jgi:hypothetical protein
MGDRIMKLRKQKGLTFIGFIIVLGFVIFFTYLGMRIGPIYLEYYSVVSSMNGVAAERGSAQFTPFTIKRKMLDRLYLSYASDNVKEQHIKIVRRNGIHMRVTYEVRKPVMGNLDVIASFDNMVQLSN